MKAYTQKEIDKLQNSLSTIRRAGGWTAEEFGDMIGVTKQTISNLETKRSKLSKTQYIAIRAVLDYEISDNPDNTVLASTVKLCLDADNLSDEEVKKAQAFVSGATKAGLESAAIAAGLGALLGIAIAETLFAAPVVIETSIDASVSWLSKLLKDI